MRKAQLNVQWHLSVFLSLMMIVSIGCEGDSSANGSEPVGGDAMPDTAGASIGQGGSTIANMPSAAGTSGSREGGQPAFGGFDSLPQAGRLAVGGGAQGGMSAPRAGVSARGGSTAIGGMAVSGGRVLPLAGQSGSGGSVSDAGGQPHGAGQAESGGVLMPTAGQIIGGGVPTPMAGQPAFGGMIDVGGAPVEECLTPNDYLTAYAWPEVFNSQRFGCVGCHVQGGPGQNTRFVLVRQGEPDWVVRNMETIRTVVDARIDGKPLILMKPLGEPVIQHGGGRVLGVDGPQYAHLEELVYRMTGQLDNCGAPTGADPRQPIAPDNQACDELRPGRRQLRRLSHVEYQNTIRDLLGVEMDASGAFVADSVVDGFANNPDALFVGGLLAEQYRQMAESLAERVDLDSLLPCELGAATIECGHEFIAQFGFKAFRRPLTSGEIAAYRSLFREAVADECYEQGVRWVITAMLQSPHFLYRSELGTKVGEDFELTSYEIASQLSYMLWQTMPDEDLMALAKSGQLLDAQIVSQQVTRLLGDDRSLAMANDFVGRWLHTDQLMRVIRDSIIYKDLYFETRESMLKETEFLVDELWRGGRPFTELFTSEFSWLDERLAAYYDIDRGAGQPNDEGFVRVRVEEARPGGVLTQGSFLTTHASPTTSSPIMRGVAVQERILCVHLDPPPVGLVVMPPPFDPNASTREKFAQHSSDAACRGCHNLIDPVGFGFEGFDGIGRWRETDGGQPVDTSGELTRREGEPTSFNGVGELSDLLANDWQVTHCYARQWLRFGFGESEGLDAECYNDHLANELVANQSNIRGVLEALTKTPHFVRRTGEANESAMPWTDLAPTAPNAAVDGDDPAIPPDDLPALACGIAPPMSDGEVINDARLEVRESGGDTWMTGYCRTYIILNTSDEPVVGWAVRIEVPGPIGNAYNVIRDRDDGLVTFRPIDDWARTIAPGAQFGFGFCGSR